MTTNNIDVGETSERL